ncbi:ATP-dependent Clp protease ATP-binding subunit [Pedobacter punctiformis]|uniref:ATP-dependent Clp protease ATP-binding subunit n=1 Tax=Pedobacter punctiformis TaxID=3004097 RepID=A0ABT4L3A0_9SPHI|nr:ATP-dependent Clp protease ATP-binding subunit [Pedobacter sp. HCMS5-2]MCZ4242393.1 ATP-dependent Clp protease ATP-binding subunit [Pedobacter sp. HCMS5-2]
MKDTIFNSTLQFNETLLSCLEIAKGFAKENYNSEYGSAHLLRALLHRESGLTDFLELLGKDIHYMIDWAEVRIDDCPKVSALPDDIGPEDAISDVMEIADDIRLKLGLNEINTTCVLAALVKPNIGFTTGQLKSFPLREKELYELYEPESDLLSSLNAQNQPGITEENVSHSGHSDILRKYCIDKTALARENRLDPIVGRESETRQMIEILGRRNKPNVIIAGEPGVGKTALVDGFAQAIINKEVPKHLQEALLLELDFGALMAGASYKGEIEDRLKKIISALKQYHKAILFIDEMHIFLDEKGSVGSGAGNLLKPELARGEITVIGATTLEEYRKIIEPEQAFNRRFELLKVNEPNIQTAIKMLDLLAPRYEEHHQLKIDNQVSAECVRLAKRYIKDKRLPDAALDLLDRTMAAVRMMNEASAKDIEKLNNELESIIANDQLAEEDKISALKWFNSQLPNQLSPILFGQLNNEVEADQIADPDELAAHLRKTLVAFAELALVKRETIGKTEISAIVAAKTGIPIGKIQSQEKEKLLNMESYLKRRMVGQEYALKVISEAIIESRSGINKVGQPIGSFFLLGPTGTGKTELAKSIAELLFNDEKAMIRFDMSEFKEEHSAALFYGAPPGYVGYEEGGMLVNKIHQQPYSVVLFDEIEKAHQSVFDIFLQIMDEGHIHDKLGKEGDFSNALILFTSNIGSEFIAEKFAEGELPKPNVLLDLVTNYFRPEFLARLTEIVPFSPITEEMAVQIFDIQMRTLYDALAKLNITLTITDEAKHVLALNGFNSKYGARQISGVIRKEIRRPISKMIVGEKISKNSQIVLGVDEEGNIKWEII